MTDKHLGTFINPFTDFGFKKLFGSIEGAFELAKLANMSHQDRHTYELSLKYYRVNGRF